MKLLSVLGLAAALVAGLIWLLQPQQRENQITIAKARLKPDAELTREERDLMTTDDRVKIAAEMAQRYFYSYQRYPASLRELVPDPLQPEEIVDSWGTPLALRIERSGRRLVVSAGQDREFDTDDDLGREIE